MTNWAQEASQEARMIQRQITSITVNYQTPSKGSSSKFFPNEDFQDTTLEAQFLGFLIAEGFYYEIQVTKNFSVSKEVMNRMRD